MNKEKNIADIEFGDLKSHDIVETTISLMSPETKKQLLTSAVASALQRSVTAKDPQVQLEQLFRKAQSMMPAEVAHKFVNALEEHWQIDARARQVRRGPRRWVKDFMKKPHR